MLTPDVPAPVTTVVSLTLVDAVAAVVESDKKRRGSAVRLPADPRRFSRPKGGAYPIHAHSSNNRPAIVS